MISKRALRLLQREHGKKDYISSIVLLLVGIYLAGTEFGYIDYKITFFSLIVLIMGVLLFIRNISSH
ncbi:MAG: hypothetical protein PHF86_13835 [Candidatus Nanoarchaeia archaeon]|nr:hypothetical protein [Candidatus Nanoarchaeia archaeon]